MAEIIRERRRRRLIAEGREPEKQQRTMPVVDANGRVITIARSYAAPDSGDTLMPVGYRTDPQGDADKTKRIYPAKRRAI